MLVEKFVLWYGALLLASNHHVCIVVWGAVVSQQPSRLYCGMGLCC
jgi:hypothetical protein